MSEAKIKVTKNGPLLVSGGVPIVAADGITYEIKDPVALCRCGHSCNKPFCDGSHLTSGFDDEK
jgi:CDGSH-type Zn-finger protein